MEKLYLFIYYLGFKDFKIIWSAISGVQGSSGDGLHRFFGAKVRISRSENQLGHSDDHGLAQRIPNRVLRGDLRHTLVAVPPQELQRRLHRHGSIQRRFARQNWPTRRRSSWLWRRRRRKRLVGAEEHHQATSEEQKLGQEGHQGLCRRLHHRRGRHNRQFDHFHDRSHRQTPRGPASSSGRSRSIFVFRRWLDGGLVPRDEVLEGLRHGELQNLSHCRSG